MMNKKDKLNEIFATDEFNLLNIESFTQEDFKEEDQRLIDSFQEISNFYEKHKRPPGMEEVIEFKLYSRLESIRKDPSKVRLLLPYDFYNLLNNGNTKSVEPIEIINNDPYNILNIDDEDSDILEMKNVSKSNRISPEYLSRRKICQDFEDYEPIFNKIHLDLKSRKRKLTKFDPNSLAEGSFYVLNGVLLLVEKLNLQENSLEFSSGNRNRLDGKTRCIFDNETESDMLFRSLVKALQIDGFGVSHLIENSTDMSIEENDEENGFIYILKSKSMVESIRKLTNLYKIGYSNGDVTQRIRNAKNEPTYLMADVQLITSFRCFNLNPITLESKLHAFFDEVRLDIEIYDLNENIHRPREWFQVPLEVIEEAVDLIVNKNIDDFYFESRLQQIIRN